MSFLKTLTACASAAVLSGIAVAAVMDLYVEPDPDNIVATHIGGSWLLDKTLTRQLDPDADTAKMASVSFTPDRSVLKRLTSHSETYAKMQIFSAGMVKFGRGNERPYILVNRSGNMHLIWFTPSSTDQADPVRETHSKTLHFAVGKNKRHDMLFLGGTASRDAAAAFSRQSAN